jgi:hypothetical protein
VTKKFIPKSRLREREREREFRVTRGCVTLWPFAIYIKKSILKAKEEL